MSDEFQHGYKIDPLEVMQIIEQSDAINDRTQEDYNNIINNFIDLGYDDLGNTTQLKAWHEKLKSMKRNKSYRAKMGAAVGRYLKTYTIPKWQADEIKAFFSWAKIDSVNTTPKKLPRKKIDHSQDSARYAAEGIKEGKPVYIDSNNRVYQNPESLLQKISFADELKKMGSDRVVQVDDIELASILGYLSGEKSFLIELLQNINDQENIIKLIANRIATGGKFWEFVTELRTNYIDKDEDLVEGTSEEEYFGNGW